jgi:hypothetical protein
MRCTCRSVRVSTHDSFGTVVVCANGHTAHANEVLHRPYVHSSHSQRGPILRPLEEASLASNANGLPWRCILLWLWSRDSWGARREFVLSVRNCSESILAFKQSTRENSQGTRRTWHLKEMWHSEKILSDVMTFRSENETWCRAFSSFTDV